MREGAINTGGKKSRPSTVQVITGKPPAQDEANIPAVVGLKPRNVRYCTLNSEVTHIFFTGYARFSNLLFHIWLTDES